MVDWSKPFKRGRTTHHGYAPPTDKMFSIGPIIAGRPMTEWLGVSPEKAPTEDKVAEPKGETKSNGNQQKK